MAVNFSLTSKLAVGTLPAASIKSHFCCSIEVTSSLNFHRVSESMEQLVQTLSERHAGLVISYEQRISSSLGHLISVRSSFESLPARKRVSSLSSVFFVNLHDTLTFDYLSLYIGPVPKYISAGFWTCICATATIGKGSRVFATCSAKCSWCR